MENPTNYTFTGDDAITIVTVVALRYGRAKGLPNNEAQELVNSYWDERVRFHQSQGVVGNEATRLVMLDVMNEFGYPLSLLKSKPHLQQALS